MQEELDAVHTSSSLTEMVFEEIGRCIIHMREGFSSTSRSEVLHARILEMLPKEVTENTTSIALNMRLNGFFIMINPHFFLHTLQTTQQRCAVLRHTEQHFFLMHIFSSRNLCLTSFFFLSSIIFKYKLTILKFIDKLN